MIYQHPLAYLIGMQGLALLRAWGGDFDEQFVKERLAEVRRLVEDERLSGHPGVLVQSGATRDAYRDWAEGYDLPGNELLELDLPIIDAILDRVPLGVAVDTACGTGRLTARLADRGYQVTGVDRSGEMIAQARRKVSGVRFALADMHALPFADASLNLVTNALALTHAADLDAVLAEFARVLRPGGTVIISDVHPELVLRGSVPKAEGPSGEPRLAACHRRSVSDYVRAALSAGFRVRRCEELRRTGALIPDRSQPVSAIGPWRDWPWTLLGWAPEATRAAWEVPAVLVWQLELEP